jgi:7,8-dihydropterin-6-yl-methyl-4-(beta-D-ribofuranosyl)aminobenzene 5'-phosphate synthase
MVVGCSHPGILNMIDTVTSRFAKPIYLLMGGIHLFDVSEKRRNYVIDEILRNKINRLGVSHCTGEEATKILKKNHKGFFVNQGGVVTTINLK